MADPYVIALDDPFEGTTGSADLSAGEAAYFDGTDWEKADADAVTTYAEAIVVSESKVGEKVALTRHCRIVDIDAPYTQGGAAYLSSPAGAVTQTRPTGATAVKQVLGFALSTSVLECFIKPPEEVTVPLVVTGATSAYALLDTGNHGGPTLDAQNETCSLVAQIPENAVELVIAYLWLAAEATAGTPTADITVGSAIDGAQHDAVTADATLTNQALEGAAADEMERLTITTGIDATDIFRPGALIGVKVLKDDAGTDISIVFGGVMVCRCV